ncbi:MAG TPA: Smr/MutS family protein, partial [Gemmatimonadales bacterium]|nr:Smr/MutS family protein [Gemmatimonadales bacterium]
VVAGDLGRLAAEAPRTAALRVDPPPRALEQRLAESLDSDGQLRDGASRELARARRAVREARERLVQKLEALLGALDPTERAPDAAVTMREGRYVIPVRSTARARIGGIVHDESATRATVFVEPPEVIELGNALRAAQAEEQREVLRVLRELTDALRSQRDAIAAAWEMCIAFDDLCARARYAVEVNGFAPAIGGPLEIHGGRHPLLVREDLVVPFDLVLAPDEYTVLVSGPNTGGKTVLIKAVGLLALMAQSGIIPPIGPQSRLPVFSSVFADIGDRQSIAASLSTFSAHLAALRDILEHGGGGAGSLVLLDEIGSGTDPAEGGALAAAVLTTLTRRHAITLATTHLGVLKQLATHTVGIVNASLQFDAETLTPTYRLLKGVPGRSYGLAIARRLGLAAEVLDLADRAMPNAERALDALLATVEARARELEARDRELTAQDERLRREAQRLDARSADVAGREAEVQARARSLERDAREQTRGFLLEARRKVEEALGRARAAVDEATAREARRLVEKAIEETEQGAGSGEQGAGWMSLEDLKRSRGTASSTDLHRPPPSSTAPVEAATEVSLIGMRVSEAEPLVLKALDDAILADLPSLRVIHGKGTGALRQMVHDVLSRDSRVRRFGFAPPTQGGHGVTIVEFKA